MTTGTTAVPPRDDDLINEATKSYRDAVVNGKTERTRKLPTSDDESNNADTEMRKVSKKQRCDAIEQTAAVAGKASAGVQRASKVSYTHKSDV